MMVGVARSMNDSKCASLDSREIQNMLKIKECNFFTAGMELANPKSQFGMVSAGNRSTKGSAWL